MLGRSRTRISANLAGCCWLLIFYFSSLGVCAQGIDTVSLRQAQEFFPLASTLGPVDRQRAARPEFSDGQPLRYLYGKLDKEMPVRPVYQGKKLIGFLFLTHEIAPIPAYSGKPIEVLIGLDLSAQIKGIRIVAHEEPILVVGLTDDDLDRFAAQYRDQSAFAPVRVGAHHREGFVGIDGLSGATITAMVLNRSIMRSAQRVSDNYGLPLSAAALAELHAEAQRVVVPVSEPPPVESVTVVKEEAPVPAVPAETPSAPIIDQPGSSSATTDNPTIEQASISATPEPKLEIRPPPPLEEMRYADTPDNWFDLALIWQEKGVELSILIAALLVLVLILFFQDWLVVHTKLFRRIRLAYLVFTLLYIGYYCSAQLSIVNVLAFLQLLTHGFSWETLMIDPLIFVLWGFIAISIILWGRGVYCGWLCPFGALQDLIHKAARKVGLPYFEFPKVVHERLWAIKYIILIVLVGVSLESLATAAKIAEVEPFKTTLSMRFQREWWFVLYALSLLAISAFNSKFFCKYLCALGAGLSFVTRFRVFDWLRRRKECGRPCQTCAVHCQISAIKHTGEIIDNECHYCLECQVGYWDDRLCPPLIERRKKRERRARRFDIPIKTLE